jgi:hypothetical protein
LARPSELDAARLDGGDDGRAAQLVGGGGIGERLGLVLVHSVRSSLVVHFGCHHPRKRMIQ